eukprot:31151-Pelagococcus_subviridis.AAC.2
MGLSYFSTHISHLTVSKRSNTIAGTRSTRTLRRPFFRGRGARLPKAAPRTRPHVVCCQGPLRSSLSVLQSYVLSHARKRNFARATDPVRPSVRPSLLPSTSSSSPPPRSVGLDVHHATTPHRNVRITSAALGSAFDAPVNIARRLIGVDGLNAGAAIFLPAVVYHASASSVAAPPPQDQSASRLRLERERRSSSPRRVIPSSTLRAMRSSIGTIDPTDEPELIDLSESDRGKSASGGGSGSG